MNSEKNGFLRVTGLFIALCAPALGTVQIVSMTPSLGSPQVLGTPITWTATATDSNPGLLTFQFNVALPGGSLALVKDFNAGTLTAGTWTSQPFVWVPTGIEGNYQIQVVIKDFQSGETTSKTGRFQVTTLASGSTPVAVPTANPLVALFGAPSCAAGSSMRVHFQKLSSTAAVATNWVKCHPPASMNFEIAGMHPSSTYQMYSQTKTGSQVVNGPTVNFTTGALPTNISFPTFTKVVPAGPQTDTTESVILHNLVGLGGQTNYPHVATDLAGNIIWYYYPNNPTHNADLTRPLQNGIMLTIQNAAGWIPGVELGQVMAEIDLAGNIIRETNIGVIQQQLLAMGAPDAGPCNVLPSPTPVGSACLGGFHHEVMSFFIGANQYFGALADVEKIFPPGTQGDTSGLPVDIIGDMIIVLNSNWQVVWYFDTFQHAGGAPQLDINRPAVLGGTCTAGAPGCPLVSLLGPGIAPLAKDWLHANSIYYWPTDNVGGASGDLVWSSRNQDWVMKVDFSNGTGTGNILWRMGVDGDFTFNNTYGDLYPWFSGQHEVAIENNGAGPMTMFDNGNTRLAQLGANCGPVDCNSRGMAVTFDETSMQVTPVLSVDLGVFSTALGSAQLLSNGSYFFLPGIVLLSLNNPASFSIEILPTAGTDTGTQVLNLQGPEGYRAWRMPSLYNPPTT